MPLEPLTIYETTQYFRDLTSRVASAQRGSRIALMSMSYDPMQPHIAELVEELAAAAARGARVHLLIDAHSFAMDKHELPTGPTLLQQKIEASSRPHFKDKYRTLHKLEASGGHYAIINDYPRLLTNPVGGRSHIKLAIVDDFAFLGGCNLNPIQIDYMVGFRNAATIDWLYDFAMRVAEKKSVRQVLDDTDQEFIVDSQTKVFIDSGKPKQSVIYRQALDFIDSAREWLVMTCQYFPNTVTAKHLAAAVHRGVNVTLYYNHPRHHAPHMRPIQRAVILAEKTRQPSILFAHQLPKDLQRLHAKLLASEQGAMLGSHNYVTHGVNFGTAEIAIRRYDATFAHEALDVLRQNLPQNYTDVTVSSTRN